MVVVRYIADLDWRLGPAGGLVGMVQAPISPVAPIGEVLEA